MLLPSSTRKFNGALSCVLCCMYGTLMARVFFRFMQFMVRAVGIDFCSIFVRFSWRVRHSINLSGVSQMGTRSTAGCAETEATFTGVTRRALIRGRFAPTPSAWSASSDASARERWIMIQSMMRAGTFGFCYLSCPGYVSCHDFLCFVSCFSF